MYVWTIECALVMLFCVAILTTQQADLYTFTPNENKCQKYIYEAHMRVYEGIRGYIRVYEGIRGYMRVYEGI